MTTHACVSRSATSALWRMTQCDDNVVASADFCDQMFSWGVTRQHGWDRLGILQKMCALFHSLFQRTDVLFSSDRDAARIGRGSRRKTRRFDPSRKMFVGSVICFAVIMSLYARVSFCAEGSDDSEEADSSSERGATGLTTLRDPENRPPSRQKPRGEGAGQLRLLALLNTAVAPRDVQSVRAKLDESRKKRPRRVFFQRPPTRAFGDTPSVQVWLDWKNKVFHPRRDHHQTSSTSIMTQPTSGFPRPSGVPASGPSSTPAAPQTTLPVSSPASSASSGTPFRQRSLSYPGARAPAKRQEEPT
uniref:Transmembrane protein n=1 Tax=Toxoplasma gondii (strain ATCC 50861 / VEG) TaxID=432359 RepID=A0A0F7V230_TOXGV|nr:TPA: hypothetical protein BN1205_067270 [Toxoplasma gondii VEG]